MLRILKLTFFTFFIFIVSNNASAITPEQYAKKLGQKNISLCFIISDIHMNGNGKPAGKGILPGTRAQFMTFMEVLVPASNFFDRDTLNKLFIEKQSKVIALSNQELRKIATEICDYNQLAGLNQPKPKTFATFDSFIRTDGYWYVSSNSVQKAGHKKCSAIIASETQLVGLRRFTLSGTTAYFMIGGKHPLKNEIPNPSPRFESIDIGNSTSLNNFLNFNYSMFSMEGIKKFEVELDVTTMQFTERWVSCERCSELNMRSFKAFGDRVSTYNWCLLD